MAQTSDGSLEARLLELEAQLRTLRTANQTARISVLNAAGERVPLTALAFGQVAARTAGETTLTGTAGTVGGVPWRDDGPSVDVYVTGGRLRVDVAAALDVYGNRCSLFASWRIRGGVPAQADLPGAPQVVAPAYDRALELQHSGTGQNVRGAFGTFDLHTGLAPGWYRVTASYALSYSGTTGAPYGTASARRLAATPY